MKKELLWMYLCFFGLVTHSYGNINTINNVTAFLSYPVKPDWLKLEVNNTSTAYNYRPSLLGLDEFTGDRNGNIYFQWYDSDTVTNLTGAKTDQTGATVSTILRTYPATVSGETFDNYNFNHINGTLTIDGSNLPETVIYPTALLTSTVTKTYGDPDYSPDPLNSSTSYSSSNSAVATIVNNKVHIVASGTAIITLAASDGSTIQQVLTVNKAPLSIIADNKSKKNGENNPQFTLSYSGFLNGDTTASLTTAPAVSTTAGTLSPTGTYPITVSGGSSDKYEFHYTNGTMTIIDPTISKVSIVANGTTASSTYTGNYGIELSYDNDPNTYYHSGPIANTSPFILNYHLNGSAVVNSLRYSPKPQSALGRAGDLGKVRISYNTVSDATFQPLMDYDFGQLATARSFNFPFPITPSNIRIEVLDGANGFASCSEMEFYTDLIFESMVTKTYGALDYRPVVPNLNESNASYSSSNSAVATIVNNRVHIVATGTSIITIVAPDGTTTQQTLTVNKAALSVTADNKNKKYGAVNPDLTLSYSGFLNGDTIASLTTAPAVSTTASTLSPAGIYAIKANGGISSNYKFSYIDGTLTVEGNKAAIVANGTTASSVDGGNEIGLSYDKNLTTMYHSAYFTTNPVTLNYRLDGATAVGLLTYTPRQDGNNNGNFGNVSISYNTISDATFKPLIDYNFNQVATPTSINFPSTITPLNIRIVVKDGYNGFASCSEMEFYEIPSFTTTLTRTYGDSDYLLGAPNPNGSNTSYSSSDPAVATIVNNKVHVVGVGRTIITATQDGTTTQQILTVNKAALSVTADNKTKKYGVVNPDLTLSYSGFVNGDTIASLTTAPAVSTTASTLSPAGIYAIKASGGISSNYKFSYIDGTLTVGGNKAAIVANGTTASSVNGGNEIGLSYDKNLTTIYHSASFTTNPVTLNYRLDGATAVGLLTYTPRQDGINNGNFGNVSISYNTISDATFKPLMDYNFNQVATPTSINFPFTITPLNIRIVVKDGYNGFASCSEMEFYEIPSFTTTLTRTYGDLDYLLGAPNPNGSNTSYSSSDPAVATIVNNKVHVVGVGRTIITATQDGTTTQQTLTVNKATLSVTADNKTKKYGAVNPDLTVSYSGFVNGDTAGSLTTAPSVATSAVASSPAGSYDITVSGGTSGNYDFTYVNGTLTVNKAQLTVTASNKSRAYGAVNPDLTVSYSGFVNGDTAGSLTTAPSVATSAVASSPAGSYDITVSGGSSDKYDFTYAKGTLTIGKAPLTITANNKSKAYGAVNPGLTVSYSGFVNGDTAGSLTTAPSVATSAVASSPAGSYDITVSGGSSDKYEFTYAKGTLTVNKAQLTVTAGNKSRAYGAVNPDFTMSYSGFVNGDTAGSLTTAPSATTSAVVSSPLGSYDISVSGGSSDKYDFTYVKGTLTIGKVPLTVTANNQSRAYGAVNPGLTVSYSGFVNGDTAGSLTTAPSVATSAVASSSAGSYDITVSGGISDKYDFTYAKGILTIGKVPLTVTASNKSRAYGAVNPDLTLSYSGFVNGDTVGSLTTAPSAAISAVASSSAGSYDITVSGGISDKYDFTYAKGILTIGKVPLTVTASNKSRAYGAVNLDLTLSYSGFVNGDTAGSLTTAPSATTSAVASSPAGSYDITVSGGISDKYDFTYAKGTLTVNKAQLTVTAGNQSRAYGAVNPDLTVSYSGFVNGDTAGSLTTAPSAVTSAVASSPAGSYDIT
ncbi:MBG domain-containing protein, partial [Flavobacterium sp. UGB4466]|uniref:MBG domain-containing protein n=1 Tax=Flavobacterium sp. UGB4466 TaxID=2730889 RepID=UPI00192B5CE2